MSKINLAQAVHKPEDGIVIGRGLVLSVVHAEGAERYDGLRARLADAHGMATEWRWIDWLPW